MQILFINNQGGGFADHIEVPTGTTVQAIFAEKIKHGQPDDYLIRVNRQPVTCNQVLQDGDRLTITPVKIEGAIAS